MEVTPVPANLAQLRVDGLTRLQLAELRAAIATIDNDNNYVTALENPSLGGGKAGEPTLLTVVITLGPPVIAAIALWLSKQKIQRARTIKYTKIDPDGGMESFEIEESLYDEGEASSTSIQTFLEKKLGNDAVTTG
jgi:hypothetical protein